MAKITAHPTYTIWFILGWCVGDEFTNNNIDAKHIYARCIIGLFNTSRLITDCHRFGKEITRQSSI